MSKRAYLFVTASLIVANAASAGYVELVTPGNSVNLTVSIADSSATWINPEPAFSLNDASYAGKWINGNDGDLMFGLGLHDKESAINIASGPVGPSFAFQQLSLAFFNNSLTSSHSFLTGAVTITISNLHSAEAAEITGFIFTGPDAAANASAWEIFYDPSVIDDEAGTRGTLTFTNTAPISIDPEGNLWLHGQFTASAIPEPSSFAALAGVAAAAGVLTRRRQRRD